MLKGHIYPNGKYVLFYFPYPQQFAAMLQGISSFCELNMPGLQQLQYAPTAWIDRNAYLKVVNSAHNWQYAIPFLEGGWLSLPIVPNGRFWREEEGRSEQGPFYSQNVGARTPKLKPTVTGEMQKMSRYRYILRIYDQNSTPWIIGTLDHPLDCKIMADIEPGAYTITFNGSSPERAFGYLPIF